MLSGVLGMLIAAGAAAADMIELRYQDQDPGSAAYLTRVLVTATWLRIDDGDDQGDYVLLDRRIGDLYNVVHSQRTLMHLRSRALPDRPAGYRGLQARIEAVRPGTERISLFLGAEPCSQSMVAPGLWPDAAKALGEYRKALAYTQWQTWRNTPEEMRQACDLPYHVWDAAMVPAAGLPLEERDYEGRTRTLLEQDSRPEQPGLFTLPQGYLEIAPPDAGPS
jgi:hypothetical protein